MRTNSSVVGCTLVALVVGLGSTPSVVVGQDETTLSEGGIELYARALQMADHRIVDTAVVRAGLASRESPVRAATALALAQVSPTNRFEATPLLREAAVASDPHVVANAMFGLGLVRDSVSIPALNLGVGRGGDVGRAAAWALGEIGEPARETIATLLRTMRGRAQASVAAELLLAAAKVFPIDIDVIRPYLKDRNSTVRWAAAYAVARRRDAEGAAALLGLVDDVPEVRTEVARGLVWYAVRDTLREEALDALATLARDNYVQVRVNAIRSIATFGRVAQRVIRNASRDNETTVRVAAAEVAGMVFDMDPETWRDLERADTSFAYQRALVTSSVQAGSPMPQTDRWRRHSDWRYRLASVAIWERAADTVAAKTVGLIASYDEDGRIRGAGYALLAAMDPHGIDPIVQDILDLSTNDPDLEARESNPNYRRIPTPIDSMHAERPLAWYDTVVQAVVVPALQGRPRGATLVTERGTLSLEMLGLEAPITVYNFLTLAEKGYYDGLRFHRVVPNFVAQDGDPRGDGNGGPGYAIRDELNRMPYRRGAVGMALAGPDTGGSQYFLTLSNQPHLDGRYPLFARVVTGRAVLDLFIQGDMIKRIAVQ